VTRPAEFVTASDVGFARRRRLIGDEPGRRVLARDGVGLHPEFGDAEVVPDVVRGDVQPYHPVLWHHQLVAGHDAVGLPRHALVVELPAELEADHRHLYRRPLAGDVLAGRRALLDEQQRAVRPGDERDDDDGAGAERHEQLPAPAAPLREFAELGPVGVGRLVSLGPVLVGVVEHVGDDHDAHDGPEHEEDAVDRLEHVHAGASRDDVRLERTHPGPQQRGPEYVVYPLHRLRLFAARYRGHLSIVIPANAPGANGRPLAGHDRGERPASRYA
jgi:hypothetical protein